MRLPKFILALFIIDLLLFIRVCCAQEPTVSSAETTVHQVFNNFVNGDSFLKYKAKRYPEAKGSVTYVVVVKGKKVETIYVENSDIAPVAFVNAFSNYIKDMTFDFKLPKGERLKLTHNFIIQ